jgi:2-alkyl-3-oxoalkanoate reductase
MTTNKQPRTAFVTGATGLIGGQVVATMLSNGWRVIACVRSPDPQTARHRVIGRLLRTSAICHHRLGELTCVIGDLVKGFPSSQIPSMWMPSLVVHCAASTSFHKCANVLRTNVEMAANLLSFIRSFAVPPRTFILSTAAVCMSPLHSEIEETNGYGGYCNEYTQSKRLIEKMFHDSSLDAVILRPSIVLSRGVNDRKFARSVLWALPAAGVTRIVPVDFGARIDIVPVDWVSCLIERLGRSDRLKFSCYHLSAGTENSVTPEMLLRAGAQRLPALRRVRSCAAYDWPGMLKAWPWQRRKLAASLDHYLPFINSGVTYSNRRVAKALGADFQPPPPATTYISSILKQISTYDALRESELP